MVKTGSWLSPADIPQKWRDILLDIPGYDAIATAGDCMFDAHTARRRLDFFPEMLRHVKGDLAGQPFKLERWEQAIVANLYGWKRLDGTRRYRQTLLFVARKNGKTPLAAGLILCSLWMDGEPGAEIYGAAAEYQQACLVFEHAVGMVEQEPKLADKLHTYKGQAKSIVLESSRSAYRVISSQAFSKHGYNTHMAVVDELHAQATPELVDVLETSFGARRQPLLVMITTSDFERPDSVCNEKHEYASNVRDGVVDDQAFLPFIYEATDKDDWKSDDAIRKANPNVGVSVSWEYLHAARAKAISNPRFENTYKRLHLNIRTEQDVRWLPMEQWDACAGEPVNPQEFAGRECWAGLDLATTTDLTALVLVFPEKMEADGLHAPTDDLYHALCYVWAPREHARERGKKDGVDYLTWGRQGLIELTDGPVTDYRAIRATINALSELYQIREIAFDPFNATHLATELQNEDGAPMVLMRQGPYTMSEPCKSLERILKCGRLHHGGHAVARWCASNVVATENAGGLLMLNKAKSTGRIDVMVALVMALGRAMAREQVPDVSAMLRRGLVVV